MLRTLAQIFSYVFHPLLLMTYMVLLLLLINPYQFGVYSFTEQWKLVLLVLLTTFGLPAIALGVMKGVGLVSSFELENRQERIGPYIIAGVFYLWIFINFKNNPSIPLSMTIASLGATMALFVIFFVNNFTKISAHAAGMGGLTGIVAINTFRFSYDTFSVHTWFFGSFEMNTNFLLMLIIVLSGLVCSFRLYLKAHTPHQIYWGYGVGLVCQFIALLALE